LLFYSFFLSRDVGPASEDKTDPLSPELDEVPVKKEEPSPIVQVRKRGWQKGRPRKGWPGKNFLAQSKLQVPAALPAEVAVQEPESSLNEEAKTEPKARVVDKALSKCITQADSTQDLSPPPVHSTEPDSADIGNVASPTVTSNDKEEPMDVDDEKKDEEEQDGDEVADKGNREDKRDEEDPEEPHSMNLSEPAEAKSVASPDLGNGKADSTATKEESVEPDSQESDAQTNDNHRLEVRFNFPVKYIVRSIFIHPCICSLRKKIQIQFPVNWYSEVYSQDFCVTF